MANSSPRTYLLVGHVTADVQADESIKPGGTVTYAAMLVKNMGWRPHIVTAAAPNFQPPQFLADVDWRLLPSAETTTFRNVYAADGSRQQLIGPIAAPITAAAIPDNLPPATVIHLGPVAQELPPDIVSAVEAPLLVATPQGWLRRWDEAGRVSQGRWTAAGQILPHLQAVVISIEDIADDWQLAADWAAHTSSLVVTQGDEGCTLFQQGRRWRVPPRPATPVDLTGAGDMFAAAFFIRLHESGDPWQAACFANVAASLAIEQSHPAQAPQRHQIESYLAENPIEPMYG